MNEMMTDVENINVLDEKQINIQCCICGKPLLVPESREAFIGPICSEKYGYFLHEETSPQNPDAYHTAIQKAELDINLENGLNKACNRILFHLAKGMPQSKAEAALDAIHALGFSRMAMIVGSALQIAGYDGANLNKDIEVIISKNYIYIKNPGRVPSEYWKEHLSMIQTIPGRKWDKNARINYFEAWPQSARGVIDLCNRWFPFATISNEVKELAKLPDRELPKAPEVPKTATITVVSNGIHIVLPKYNGNFVNDIKTNIPGRNKKWVHENRAWWVSTPFIDQAIAVTTAIYPDAQIDEKLSNLKEQIEKQKELATAVTVAEEDEIRLHGGKLYPFQSAGVRFLELKIAQEGGAMIADDMGLGKTCQSLAFISRNNSRLPTLISCPAAVKLNWARQVMIWIDGDIKCVVVEGNYFFSIDKKGRKINTKYNMENLKEMNPDIVICNYDLLKRNISSFSNYGFQTFILDESHYVKESKSGRSKAAREIAKNIPRRVLLTGTPVLNRPRELWHQLHIIDPVVWSNFYPFGYRYCDPVTNRWGTTFNGAENLEELHNRVIGHFMVRRRKKEVLKELPDKTVFRTQLEIPSKERKEYDTALFNFRQWALEAGGVEKLRKIMQAEAISKLTTLKRLCAEAKTSAVVEHCKEWLDSNEDEQLVIFAHHQSVLDALEDAMRKEGYNIATIRGGDTATKRQEAVDRFKAGNARIFIASIQAAGTGTDGLQVAQNMKIIERTWRPADLSQAEDRLYRIGQENNVMIEYLDMAESIDDKMAEIIEEKMDTINQIVDGSGSAADIGDISADVLTSILEENS